MKGWDTEACDSETRSWDGHEALGPQVWAFANQKGGCGKTTVAVNLASALARRGERVLLVDLDPQAHATLALGRPAGIGTSIAQVFLDDAPLLAAVCVAPGGFSLCPSSLTLGEFESIAERRLHPEGVLARALAPVVDRYDRVLVDCPPRADGVLTANAVRAATHVALVVETGAFALQGALRARALLEHLHADLDVPPVYRVVATMFDRRTRFSRDVLVGMQARFSDLLFTTPIRESVRLREAAAFGVPIHELDARSNAARDFDALAREFPPLVRDGASGPESDPDGEPKPPLRPPAQRPTSTR